MRSLRLRQDTPAYPGHLYLAFSNLSLHKGSQAGPRVSRALLEPVRHGLRRSTVAGPLVEPVGGGESEERGTSASLYLV